MPTGAAYAGKRGGRYKGYIRNLGKGKRVRDGTSKKSYGARYTLSHMSPSRSINERVHFFERSFASGSINESGAGNTYGSLSFKLDNFSGYAELAALFDKYKIMKINVKWLSYFNVNDVTNVAASGAFMIPMLLYPDFDDDTAPASAQEVMEHSNLIVHRVGESFEHVLNPPHVLRMVYQSAIATSYESVPSSQIWLSTANAAIPHYGFKYWFGDTGLAANVHLWKLIVTATIVCKNIK